MLPTTAHPALRHFYEQFLGGALTDIPNAAMQPKPSPTSTASPPNSSTRYSSEGQNSSAGAAWFQLCSNLPRCEYLCHMEVTPQGAPRAVHVNTAKPSPTAASSLVESYELAPNLPNVCRALQQLLCPPLDVVPHDTTEPWTRLEHVAAFWNAHIDALSTSVTAAGLSSAASASSSSPPRDWSRNKIRVEQSRSIFRAPLSDTEMIYRDIGTVHVRGSPFLMQAELEPAHQLAAVKFVRAPAAAGSQEQRLWQQPLRLQQSLAAVTAPRDHTASKDTADFRGIQPQELLSLFQGILFPNQLMTVAPSTAAVATTPVHTAALSLSQFHQWRHLLLSAKWGEEKWKPSIVTTPGEIALTQSTMSLSFASQATTQYTALRRGGIRALGHLHSLAAAHDTNDSAGGQSLMPQWQELVAWWFTDHHRDLSTGDVQGLLAEWLLQKPPHLTAQDTAFLRQTVLPFLLQYRLVAGASSVSSPSATTLLDGGYLLASLALQLQSRTLDEPVIRCTSLRRAVIFARQPQLDVYRASSKSFETVAFPLTVAQRWDLLRRSMSSPQ